jgi:fructoselysine 6-kinase
MRVGTVGDNVVDRYHGTGMMYPGGGAANMAVHARRFGCESLYLGVIGSDAAGALVAGSLTEEGVSLELCRRPDEANAITDVSISPTGNRVFTSFTSSTTPIVLAETDRARLAGSDWLYTNYSSGTEGLVPELAGLAPLAFDFSYKDEEYAAPLLRHVHAAAFSRDTLSDEEAVALIRRVQDAGPSIVVVTRGARGAIVARGGDVHFEPADRITPVDTLGAGDAFLARFVCGLGHDESLATAARAATMWASAVCLHHGAFGHAAPIAHDREETIDV